jgi:GDP-4-dehydro-6-deoxy-D-mannose reductase
MSVLVTGGSGTLGYHLLNIITKTKGDLISFSNAPPLPFRTVGHVVYETGNLLDFKSVHELLQKYKPAEIYHIASQSSIKLSHLRPFETLSTNLLGTQNLLEAARQVVPKSRILLLSSSEIYGKGSGLLDVLHEETDPPNPLTPFATSKACMEILGFQFRNAYDMHISIVRPFYFSGPYHGSTFVLPSTAAQVLRVVNHGGEPVVYTGNLDVSRDIIDVRDMARGLVLIMNTSESGEVFNLCSGKVRTIRELVEMIIDLSGISFDLRVDLELERTIDLPMLMGSPEKIMTRTGWKPMISIEDSIVDLYNEMNRRIKTFG